ncbi:DNA sulfur modification protein DndB [Planococcus salinarum]|uniref:DNA sulfur modification protein DndB n=1 Tax=Planococcus salinarum TaxID=622695 RepID=UPI000E3BC4C4|nr:DNA sulfur modification protein DndB [Planococcus salinarum]TAA72847.1 hypothetical protein D2909_04455 [Planococcus salinarum]
MISNEIFTKKQTIINYPIKELVTMLAEGRLKVREKNQLQIRKIRNYIFDNVLTDQIYFPPLVAYLEEGKLEDGKPHQLTIIDGTQRILALSQTNSMIVHRIHSEVDQERKQGLKLLQSLNNAALAVQIFEGLGANEADQLYIDLNTKGKKVSLSKRIAYDSRNEINRITNEILIDNDQLKGAGVEEEKRAVIRPNNKNFVSLSQLRQLVGLFITGKTISSSLVQENLFTLNGEENIELINLWFKELFKLHPVETIGEYEECMLASFPLLYSLATYAIGDMEELSFKEKRVELLRRMEKLRGIDWRPSNKIWRTFKGSERGSKRLFFIHQDKANMAAMVTWLQFQGGE